MNKEISNGLKKTFKLAALTCVSAGAVVLAVSDVARKAVVEGYHQAKDAIEKILDEEDFDGKDTVDADSWSPVTDSDFVDTAAEAEPAEPAEPAQETSGGEEQAE